MTNRLSPSQRRALIRRAVCPDRLAGAPLRGPQHTNANRLALPQRGRHGRPPQQPIAINP